ncbi:MAG: hypothetical protein IPM56_16915 [Ignavibacteriales bacterium]|nr:MAG: hypothetical protein IPM56_16915 [Ignavibacteriales bacterium]
MSSEDLNEKIFAAALGCLDNNDLLKFRELSGTQKDFPEKNYAVYQQLVSLLPLILDNAEPDKNVKDKIARKVYRLKDTAPNKFIDSLTTPSQKPQNETKEITDPEEENNISQTSDNIIINVQKEEVKPDAIIPEPVEVRTPANIEIPKQITERFEKINSLSDDSAKDDIVFTQRKLDIPIEDKKRKQPRREQAADDIDDVVPVALPKIDDEGEKKSKFFTILLILITAVVLVGAAFMYIKFTGETDKYFQQVNTLNNRITVLNDEAAANKKLLDLFESENLKVINLNPLKGDSTSMVRILLDNNYRGFLQTKFSGTITPGKTLRLWGLNEVEKLMLVEFKGEDQNKFYPVDVSFPSSPSEVILVLSTETIANSIAQDSLVFSGSFFFNLPAE